MRVTDISDISIQKDVDSRLKDKKDNLAISVSLAAGLAWENKVLSFYEIIAKELLEIFDNNLLDNAIFKKMNKNYIRMYIDDHTLYFNRNNIFLNVYEEIGVEEWLQQELLIIENKNLPKYLTSYEKEKLFKNMTEQEVNLVNKNYSKQELNTNKFNLNLIPGDESRLINLLTKYDYFSLSIYDYIQVIASGEFEYKIDSTDKGMKYFRSTYNSYILELGSYVSKVIGEYLNGERIQIKEKEENEVL